MLAEIWPSMEEIKEVIASSLTEDLYAKEYGAIWDGDEHWRALSAPTGETMDWHADSTYVRQPPFFTGMPAEPHDLTDITGMRALAVLGDSITTDHISPAGVIQPDGPAGRWLLEHGVEQSEFNSYGARRGNHEVMVRGTFANIRLRNELVPGTEGGFSRLGDEVGAVYDVAMKHKEAGTPTVVIAGKEYGTGSSRDWAAKGTNLLGVRTVIVESFERIHRSNLVGMGVLPLQFKDGDSRTSLGLTGDDTFTILGVANLKPRQDVEVKVTRADGTSFTFTALCRIDTANEVEYFNNGGILQYVLRKLAA